MAKYSYQDYALILAGIFRTARQSVELAQTGQTQDIALSLRTLFVHSPNSVLEVYDSVTALRFGLNTLVEQFSQPTKRNGALLRCSVQLMQLGKQLLKQSELHSLSDALQKYQSYQFSEATQYHRLAGLYQQYISILSPRIIMQGQAQYLKDPLIQSQIRSVLLAGVRSAHLWYQCGGRRWHLLTRSQHLLRAGQDLLAEIA